MPAPNEVARFERFAALVGLDLEPFQRAIAAAVFGPQREVVVIMPRGQGKSRLAACIALYHLLSTREPSVYVGAASREQATVCFEYARAMAQTAAVARHVIVRHRELRAARGNLRVLASDAALAHGLTPSLVVGDELWAWKGDLLDAFTTALVKRPDAKLVIISTAAPSLDSPLGRMRARALAAPSVEHHGALTDCAGPDLRMLEWSTDADPDDLDAALAANPASWIDRAALERQRASVPEVAYRQFHLCQFGSGESAWLPPGKWQECADPALSVDDGAEVVVGVDIGGSRAASAIVAVTRDLRVAHVEVHQGNEAVLKVTESIRELARRFAIAELVYDPWRYASEALRLQDESGVVVVEFPQSIPRMTVASEGLHKAIVEGKLRHPDDAELNRHVAAAVARPTPRGWRLDKGHRAAQIDAVVALAMAVERASYVAEATELIGWLDPASGDFEATTAS